MMVVKPYAEFKADFPDDQIGEGDETEQYGGKNVTEAIAAILVGLGCTIEGIVDEEEHGWECRFLYEGLTLWFRLWDFGDDYAFRCDEPHPASAKYDLFLRLLMKLNDALRRDGRFHDLAWYGLERSQPVGEPSEAPVIGEIPSARDIEARQGFFQRLLAPMRVRPKAR